MPGAVEDRWGLGDCRVVGEGWIRLGCIAEGRGKELRNQERRVDRGRAEVNMQSEDKAQGQAARELARKPGSLGRQVADKEQWPWVLRAAGMDIVVAQVQAPA